MAYEGYVDNASDRAIAGWVFDSARENDALTVEILAGFDVVATVKADIFRADLLDVGKGNGRHAFRYELSANAPGGTVLGARIKGKRWQLQESRQGKVAPIHHDPRRIYLHTLDFGYPQVASGFTEGVPSADEEAIVERIIEAFHRTLRDDPAGRRREKDLWSEIHSIYHREPYDLLRRRDVKGLATYLRDAHARGLTFGITQGIETTEQLRANPDAARAVLTQFVDNLVSLAEYLGILDVESPAQRGQYGENFHADPQMLVDRIAAQVGFAIEPPPAIGAYFGIKTAGGILAGRDIGALYAALRARDIGAEAGVAMPVVCEIGGGLGGVAYYAARIGMNYTIVDLPLVSALQAYFLLRALPGKEIQLYGESGAAAPAIRLLPTFCFGTGEGCDVLLNQDSFPEMSAAYGVDYLRKSQACVRHAFYSINQEARAPQQGQERQTVVRELVVESGAPWRRVARFRHWLRAGYVEEVYRR